MSILQEAQTEASIDTPNAGFVRLFYKESTNQWGYRDSSGAFRYFSEGVTREEVEDLLANSFQDSATITWIYNDTLNFFEANIESSVLSTINSALQSGDNISSLANDAGYVNSLGAAGAAPVQSVNSQTGAVVITKSSVGLSNVDNTSDSSKPVSTAQAQADTAVQNFSISRANHSGSQLSSTISDFASSVRSTILTGISFGSVALVLASDTILSALGKLQAQINAMVFGRQFEDFINTVQVNFSGGLALRRSYTTQSNPVGRYRVSAQIQFEPSSTNSNDEFELRVNGSPVSLRFENEAKDTGGDIRNIIHLVGYYQHTSSGTFNIEIWGGNDGGTTELNGSLAEVWRVS